MTPEQKLEAARANLVDAINGLLCDGFKTARGFCVPLDALIAAAREDGAAEERARCLSAVADEPELPGVPSGGTYREIERDPIGYMRALVRVTKRNIAERIRLPLPDEEGDRDE